ncbi:response regulator [Formosa sp. PL04]|uniref:tetratricopeptide repeat-containing hybrid sensor histidine kinase/response regulator n=1 Tax=Formosa sp. PL04 TaxID=3081755 RepID=UPI002981076E|nr:response regulator [Formosa sp. PL04]MDW5288915.1 response regulator [Formosa sp. PL04]
MRITLLFLTFLILPISLHAQNKHDGSGALLNSSESEILIHLDSIKELMIIDYYKEDYNSVILTANEILKLAQRNNLPLEVIKIHSYLANSYLQIKDSIKSIAYARKNIELSEQVKDTTTIIGSQIDLGNIYVGIGEFDKGLNSFKNAIPLAEKQNNKMAIFILNYNIAEIFFNNLKDPESAKPYLDIATKNVPENFKFGHTGLGLYKGHYAFYNKDYDLASSLYQQTIVMAKEINYIQVLRESYEGYINCLVINGDYKKAYEIGKIEDSLSQARSKEEIEKSARILTAGLKNAKIQEELENKELRNELVIEKAETQKKLLMISVFVSILLLGLLLYLLRVIKIRRRLNLELIKKNQEYLEAKLESEKLAQAKSRFLSTMSHELRTPLYGIIGLSTILNNDENLKSHKSELQSLKFSADYLLNLVNDVLTLNKMDSNEKNKLESKAFVLKDFLNNIKESLEYITGQTNNDFIISLDSKIPDWIKGDQTKLSQILINLIGNALKFTDNGHVQLAVTLLENVKNNLIIKFEVKDNGKGISEIDQQKIFKEFRQLKHQGYFQGSGLGLTIVQKLLIDMGSNIQLESVVDEGSNFFFEMTFAIAKKKTPQEDICDKTTIEVLQGKKVLVVDDNSINLLVTKKTLESHGIFVEVATNGLESIDKIKQTDYDIVLMDVNMPIMNGIEATKKIRELNKSVIIIALTAVTQDEQENRFKDSQFDDAIVKPYKMNEFLNTLASNLIKNYQSKS